MNEKFDLVIRLLKKYNYNNIPNELKELVCNPELLSYCIDDLLIKEMCMYGLQVNGEPNQYGKTLDDAIGYLNSYRIKKT